MIDDWQVRHTDREVPERGLGLRQVARLPRHAHFERARGAGVLRAGAIADHRQDRLALARRGDDRHGAELAGPRRADREVRHREAEELLPAAAGQGRGDPLLLAHRADVRLGRGDHARYRHRHARRARRRRRHPPVVGQALHHAGAQGDAGRPGVPRLRPREHPGQGREPRHHRGADPGQASGRADRAPPSAVGHRLPQRSQLGQGRVHPHRLGDRRREDGGPGLAHADGVPGRGPRHLAAVVCHRRHQGDAALHLGLWAHPQAVRVPRGAHGGHRGAAWRAWSRAPTHARRRAR